MLAVTCIINKSLRALMTGLLGGANYTMNQASYDLARLRVNGLITRIPAKNRYRLTSDGLRFAIFYTKVHDRLLRPLLGGLAAACAGRHRWATQLSRRRGRMSRRGRPPAGCS